MPRRQHASCAATARPWSRRFARRRRNVAAARCWRMPSARSGPSGTAPRCSSKSVRTFGSCRGLSRVRRARSEPPPPPPRASSLPYTGCGREGRSECFQIYYAFCTSCHYYESWGLGFRFLGFAPAKTPNLDSWYRCKTHNRFLVYGSPTFPGQPVTRTLAAAKPFILRALN